MKKNRIFAVIAALCLCTALPAQKVITLDQLKKQQEQKEQQSKPKQKETTQNAQPARQAAQTVSQKSYSPAVVAPFQTFYAQWNFASAKSTYKGHSESHSDSYNGGGLGYSYAFPLSATIPLYIEPGIAAQYFFRSKDDVNTNIISATIPVNILYSFPAADILNIEPFAGLYARGNIWGEVKSHGHSYNLFKKESENGEGYDRFQFGFQAGLRLRIAQKFFIGGAYVQDLNGIYDHDGFKIKLHSFTVTVGSVF